MNLFLRLPLRGLRRAALAALGVAFLGTAATAETPKGEAPAPAPSFWTDPSGATQSLATRTDAQRLGDLSVKGAVEDVHHRFRRRLFLRPGFYRRGWHGHRYRYSHGPYRYRYHGWWYRRPWWLVEGYHPRYPRRAYYYQRYAVPHGGRCDYWAGRCARNWGRRNPDFYGCLRYHGCR